MRTINGIYYYPASSKAESAELQVTGDVINLYYQQRCILVTQVDNVTISSTIPGVNGEVIFADGGKFVAADNQAPFDFSASVLGKIEKNTAVILAAVVLVPLLMWFCISVVMPKAASAVVLYLPDTVAETMGEQAFSIIETTLLKPSELSEEKQLTIKNLWQTSLTQLELPDDKFVLHIYGSDYFGPNAFALPDGTVVITDPLLEQLADNPDAILAILLHEIGHVENKHSLRMVAQSVSSTVVFALIFGDIEGVGEVLLGTGTSLLQNAFSRDMEREADDYALNQLIALGKSPEAFADAMQSFLDLKSDHHTDSALKYFSSHPDIKERIEKAQKLLK